MSGIKNYICEYCGKGVQYAHNVSHAKNRTRKLRKPNLRVFRVVEGKEIVKRRICMSCLKSAVRPHADKLRVETVVKTVKTS